MRNSIVIVENKSDENIHSFFLIVNKTLRDSFSNHLSNDALVLFVKRHDDKTIEVSGATEQEIQEIWEEFLKTKEYYAALSNWSEETSSQPVKYNLTYFASALVSGIVLGSVMIYMLLMFLNFQ